MLKNNKKETRGRKPTGRVRTLKLSAKFTEDEKTRILEIVKERGLTQSEFIIEASELIMAIEERVTKESKKKVGGRE